MGTVRRRGQGEALAREQVAVELARGRVARELRAAGWTGGVDVVWSPEQTAALRAELAGKGVRAA